MKPQNEISKEETQSVPSNNSYEADPFFIMYIPPDYPGNNNNVCLIYRTDGLLIQNFTEGHFNLLLNFRTKLRERIFSEWDFGKLVPQILNVDLFSKNEIAMLSNIMHDWINHVVTYFPDKKEHLTELKKFINEHVSKPTNYINQQEEVLSIPKISIKERYTLLSELGIIELLQNKIEGLQFNTSKKAKLLAMILGLEPNQLKLSVTYEGVQDNKNNPLADVHKEAIWEKLNSIEVYKPTIKRGM